MNDPSKPVPVHVVLHKKSRTLELGYADGKHYHLPFEFLRVYSPSAEVQGHNPKQAVLQVGKRHVEVTALEVVGHYAVQPTFSDGHNTGIYSWGYLYQLATEQTVRWQAYLDALAQAQAQRDPPKIDDE